MNKSVVLILILLGIGLVAGYVSMNKPDSEMKSGIQRNQDSSDSVQTGDSIDASMDTEGRYVFHTDGILDQFVSPKKVLFFYASWCPTCRPVDADLRSQQEKLPKDVMVIRVNYNDPDTNDEEKQLARKYGITYQHTFVYIDAQGKEVKKWNGGGIDEILENVR